MHASIEIVPELIPSFLFFISIGLKIEGLIIVGSSKKPWLEGEGHTIKA